MNKSITIFGNSTPCTPMSDRFTVAGECWIELLCDFYKNRKEINGHWINGMTMAQADGMIERYLNRRIRDNWVILHLGACEAFTEKPANFLQGAIYWLNHWERHWAFDAYVLPKMERAAYCLTHNIDEYFRYFEPEEFQEIFHRFLKKLEGFSVIVIGMSFPNEYFLTRRSQANEFNVVLKDISSQYNNVEFLNIFDLCRNDVVDTNHLTQLGHNTIFSEIVNIIGVLS